MTHLVEREAEHDRNDVEWLHEQVAIEHDLSPVGHGLGAAGVAVFGVARPKKLATEIGAILDDADLAAEHAGGQGQQRREDRSGASTSRRCAGLRLPCPAQPHSIAGTAVGTQVRARATLKEVRPKGMPIRNLVTTRGIQSRDRYGLPVEIDLPLHVSTGRHQDLVPIHGGIERELNAGKLLWNHQCAAKCRRAPMKRWKGETKQAARRLKGIDVPKGEEWRRVAITLTLVVGCGRRDHGCPRSLWRDPSRPQWPRLPVDRCCYDACSKPTEPIKLPSRSRTRDAPFRACSGRRTETKSA